MVPVLALLSGCAEPEKVGETHALEPYLPETERIESVPVYGGTMETAPELGGFVAADPEGDRLVRVVGTEVVELDLGFNARPFRVHVDGVRAWVTLRGTGELASVALDTMTLLWKTRVCLEPRGVARVGDATFVACAGGEIVEVDADGHLTRLAVIESDLRDVVPVDDTLFVSRFATAEILQVDSDTLTVDRRIVLGEDEGVAWRMRPYVWGIVVLHQIASSRAISLAVDDATSDTGDEEPAAYGGDNRIVSTAISQIATNQGHTVTSTTKLLDIVGGTDFAVNDTGIEISVANTGAGPDASRVSTFVLDGSSSATAVETHAVEGEGLPTAVALDVDGTLVLQSAAPFAVARAGDPEPVLSARPDPNAEVVHLFHVDSGVGLSCASCHPEGLDDGHVWVFLDAETSPVLRRTMPLAGHLLSRQPYHWDASLPDPDAVMADTFEDRMGGEDVDAITTQTLFDWLDELRHVRAHPAAPDSDVDVGRTAFAKAGCDTCHTGVAYTNSALVSIGRPWEVVKTPSLLGVGVRNLLLHDGCHLDLQARFTSECDVAPDTHGDLTRLTDEEIAALEAFLRTL
jgi:hypothetical protein